MNKIVTLLLLVSGSAYGSMGAPNPNRHLNHGKKRYIQLCTENICALNLNLSQVKVNTALRTIVPDKAPLLRDNRSEFVRSVASDLRDTGIQYYDRRSACSQALGELSFDDFDDLLEQ